MPTSQHPRLTLQQQYHHLRRDWDHYKTSMPHHRRSYSTADLPSTAADFNTKLLQISPKKLVSSSLQHTAPSGRRLLEDFEKAKEAEAVKIESLLGSGNYCSSPSSMLAWDEYKDERSSSSHNDDDGLGEKDGVRGEKQEWMERLRLFGVVMMAVAVGLFSFGFVFEAEDVGQLMTPT